LKGGLVARSRIKKLERSAGCFDAVFFNHTIPATFLSKFRKRVPTVLSLDVTPEVLAPYSTWYRGRSQTAKGPAAFIKAVLLRSVYADAAYILAWSDLVRQSLVNHYGIDSRKIKLVPPGIDLKRWAVFSEKRRVISSTNGHIKILFVGADFQRKGGDILLRIAQRKEFRNCDFYFVTRSFNGAGGANVHVLDNVRPNSGELQKIYQKSDIFVLPTHADLSPNAVCEAQAFGLPVITTDVGAVSEIVKENINGLLVPDNDEEKLAGKLMMLVRSRGLRSRLGKNGMKSVRMKYDIDKNAAKVIDYLIKAASKYRLKATG
jgi:glycosyltransferase involved in cell wall biosynthesis